MALTRSKSGLYQRTVDNVISIPAKTFLFARHFSNESLTIE